MVKHSDLGWRVDEHLVLAVQLTNEPVVVLDEACRIVMVNDHLLTLTGFTRAGLLGAATQTLFPAARARYPRPDLVTSGGPSFRAERPAGPVTVNVARADGSLFAARLLSTPARSCAHGAIRIISVRPAVQLALEDIGLGGLLESAPDATVVLDPGCRVVLANSRARNMFGRDGDQMDGLSFASLFPEEMVGPAHGWLRDRYEEALRGADIDSQTTGFPVRVLRPDGDEVPVEIAVTTLHVHEGMLLRAAFRDVSERLRLQAETERLKEHFLATVSHELRTPLTSILGYTELLEDLDGEDLSEQGRHFVEVVGRNARRELRLVDDLLTLVTLGDGQLPIRAHSTDLGKVVLESVEALEPTAHEGGVKLIVEREPDGVQVLGDPDRLGQAFDNLISNAIKFSAADSRVTVRLEGDQQHACVQVIDEGPGIVAHDRARVFERLYRGTQAVAEEKPGAGLGLTIVKAIVEAHRGSVAISSPAGGGTRVDVVLPVSSEAPEARDRLPAPSG